MTAVHFIQRDIDGDGYYVQVPRDLVRRVEIESSLPNGTSMTICVSFDLQPGGMIEIASAPTALADQMFQDLIVHDVDVDVTWECNKQGVWARWENKRPTRWIKET